MVKIVGTGHLPEEERNNLDSTGAAFNPADLSELEREGVEAFKRWKAEAEAKKKKRAGLQAPDPEA